MMVLVKPTPRSKHDYELKAFYVLTTHTHASAHVHAHTHTHTSPTHTLSHFKSWVKKMEEKFKEIKYLLFNEPISSAEQRVFYQRERAECVAVTRQAVWNEKPLLCS